MLEQPLSSSDNSGATASPDIARLLELKRQPAIQISDNTPRVGKKPKHTLAHLKKILRDPTEGWTLIEARIKCYDLPKWFESQVSAHCLSDNDKTEISTQAQ